MLWVNGGFSLMMMPGPRVLLLLIEDVVIHQKDEHSKTFGEVVRQQQGPSLTRTRSLDGLSCFASKQNPPQCYLEKIVSRT